MAEHVAVMVTDASVRECVMYGNLHIRGEDTRSIGTRLTVEISKAFDAWLEAHDREVAAKAWDEGARAQASAYGMDVDAGPNPYRIERGE